MTLRIIFLDMCYGLLPSEKGDDHIAVNVPFSMTLIYVYMAMKCEPMRGAPRIGCGKQLFDKVPW